METRQKYSGVVGAQVSALSRFVRRIADAFLIGDPVHLPGRTSIVRVRLFKVSGIWSDVRPDISNENHSAVVSVLAIEFAGMPGRS